MQIIFRLLGTLAVYFFNGCVIVGFYGLISEHVISHNSDERLSIGIFLFGVIGVSIRLAIQRTGRQKRLGK